MADMTSRDRAAPPPPLRAARRPKADGPRDRSAFDFQQPHGDESIGELVRRLADQATHLADEQAQLVKAELRSSVADIKEAAGAMAGAAVLGLAGLGVTLMGIAFLLAEAMSLWLATLIVGIVTLTGAYMMYSAGREKLNSKSMSVERSRETLERAPHAVSGHISGNEENLRNG